MSDPGHSTSRSPIQMSPVDRRTFLRRIAASSAAAAAGPALAAGQLLEPDGALPQSGTSAVWKSVPCPLCNVGCGLLVAVEGGRATAVKGDPESPVSGGLACARGYYSVQALYARDRITRARIRRGGSLVEVPMDEALDLVAARISDTRQTFGNNSVAFLGSSDWSVSDAYAGAKLFRDGLGSTNVASSLDLDAAAAAVALETTFGLDGSIGCHEDIDHADVIILWDSNVAETDPVLFSRILERRRKNRAVRIVDITTRTTRTSYAADDSILLAPHTALAVANAICQELVERKALNRGFIERHVAFKRGRSDIGHDVARDTSAEVATDASFDDFVAFLATATPERAQQLSGISAARIRWIASLYGDQSRRVMSIWGGNVTRQTRGVWTNNALYNIHLLTGRVGTPGNTAFCTLGQLDGTRSGRRSTARRDALSVLRSLESGEVRFLWIQGANPLASVPNSERYRLAAAANDRFVVVSEAYPTATTGVADVVLPTALWFEREGMLATAERRIHHFEQLVRPPGEAMSDSWQLVQVARRLQMSRLFPWQQSTHAQTAWEEFRQAQEGRPQLPPITQLRARTAVWPYSGGREAPRRYSSAHDPAADRARGFDFYGHADRRAWVWLRPHAAPPEAPSREYPFWLSTGPVLEHGESSDLTTRIPTLHRAAPRAYVELNSDDARQLGVASGDRVRLVSRRGALMADARVEHRSQPPRGHLFVPSFDQTVPVQRLMLDAACPLSGQPHSTTCAVRLERVAPARGA